MRSKLANLLVTAAAVLPLTLVVACSDDPAAVTPEAKPSQTCVATLQQANGSSCFDSKVICDYPISCKDGFFQQSRCTCNGTTFSCTFQGEPVAKGTVPECKNTTEITPEACPGSISATEGKACTVTGKLCFFSGAKCADGTQNTDVCQCSGGGTGLLFKCQKRPCPTSSGDAAPPPDASPTDAGADG